MTGIVIAVVSTAYLMAGALLVVVSFNEDDAVRLYGNRCAGALLLLLAWPIVIGLEA